MKQTAVFAGGCFWGMQELFRSQSGIVNAQAVYAGGENAQPTYRNHPGHAEALKVTFNPEQTSYSKILDFFFRVHDPTTLNRQGNDVGSSYRSAIFYLDQQQKQEAEKFIEIVNNSGRWKAPVVTTLEPAKNVYPAEDYHQDYLQKNRGGYTCHFVRFDSYLKD